MELRSREKLHSRFPHHDEQNRVWPRALGVNYTGRLIHDYTTTCDEDSRRDLELSKRGISTGQQYRRRRRAKCTARAQRADRRTNGRTNERTSERAHEQANERTGEQTNERASKRASKQTSERANERAGKRANERRANVCQQFVTNTPSPIPTSTWPSSYHGIHSLITTNGTSISRLLLTTAAAACRFPTTPRLDSNTATNGHNSHNKSNSSERGAEQFEITIDETSTIKNQPSASTKPRENSTFVVQTAHTFPLSLQSRHQLLLAALILPAAQLPSLFFSPQTRVTTLSEILAHSQISRRKLV